MPRARIGGIGKTGNKQKKAMKKFQSKQKGEVSSTAAAAAASTDDDELEEPAEAAAGAAAAAAALTPVTETKAVKRVRFADFPPRVEGRFALPRSQGWTWGGRVDHPDAEFRWIQTAIENCNGSSGQLIKRSMHALKAHLWGNRVHEHVLSGCVGEWTDHYRDDVSWKVERTHRRWCPDQLPPDHADHVFVGLLNGL